MWDELNQKQRNIKTRQRGAPAMDRATPPLIPRCRFLLLRCFAIRPERGNDNKAQGNALVNSPQNLGVSAWQIIEDRRS